MRKNLLSIILLLGFILPSAARSLSESQGIAERLLSEQVSCVRVGVANGDTAYYFFKGVEQGYAVISADPRTNEVLAYNEKAKLQGDTLPRQVMDWFDRYAASLSSIPTNELCVEQSFGGNSLRASKLTGHVVKPLLGEMCWGQLTPYNDLCPMDNGIHSAAGCRCISMAQVMNYYNYPSEVKADIPAYETATLGLSIPGVPKGTQFDWDNILDDYYLGSPSRDQIEAVSELVYAVGAATSTDYTSEGSDSECSSAEILTKYFGYDRELIRSYSRYSFTLPEWNHLLVGELESGRPVLYEGVSMGGGHGFVVDGIDQLGNFHVNWGWDGVYDGYYDITLLMPPCNDEMGASSTVDGYSMSNRVVVHIVPDNGVKDVCDDPSIISVDVQYQTDEDNEHYLFFSFGSNRAYGFYSYVGVGYEDSYGKVVCVNDWGMTPFPVTALYEPEMVYALDPDAFLEDGTYKVCIIESQDGKNWRLSDGASNVFVSMTKKRGRLYRVADEPILDAKVLLPGFDDQHVVDELTCYVHLTNQGTREYYDVVYFVTSSEPENPMAYTFASGITVEANGGDNDLEFNIEPASDTIYYWVMDCYTNVFAEGVLIRDKQDGLENVIRAEELSIEVEDGTLYITSQQEGDLLVSDLAGKTLYEGRLRVDSCLRLRMKPGLYLVNGRKILIR